VGKAIWLGRGWVTGRSTLKGMEERKKE
jgi:hypothetical protein